MRSWQDQRNGNLNIWEIDILNFVQAISFLAQEILVLLSVLAQEMIQLGWESIHRCFFVPAASLFRKEITFYHIVSLSQTNAYIVVVPSTCVVTMSTDPSHVAQGTLNEHNRDPWPVDYLIKEIIKFCHKSLLPDSPDNIPSDPPPSYHTPPQLQFTHYSLRPARRQIVVTQASAIVAPILLPNI